MLPLLIPIAAALAPLAFKAIGSALAGGDGKRVGEEVGRAVQSAFGTTDPDEVARVARENPQAVTDFRVQMESIAAEERMAELKARLDDVQDARASGTKSSLIAWAQVSLAAFTVPSFVGLLWYMLVYGVPEDKSGLFYFALGTLTSAFIAIYNFFIGASTSGHSANNQLAQLAKEGAAIRKVDKQATADDLNEKEAVHVGLAPFPAKPAAPEPEPDVKARPRPSRFPDAVDMLLAHEGGFANHPRDPGRATNRGITIGTLAAWRGDKVSVVDVKALTEKEAKQIYLARYWNVMRCDDMPAGFDYMLFDFGVNAGPGRAVRFLQSILAAHTDPELDIDGAVGPHTLGALAHMSPRRLIEEYHMAKMRHYEGLEHWKDFGGGWTRRAREVLERARAMAGYKPEVGQ